MVNETKMISRDFAKKHFEILANRYRGSFTGEAFERAAQEIAEMPGVDAVEVVHGHWKEYSHSALVRWKDGEPIWADRSVFRCSRCDFGTIARHNWCPRYGSDMRERKDNDQNN